MESWNSTWEAINHNQLGFAYEEHTHNLNELNDVVVPAAGLNGQVLQWDGAMWSPTSRVTGRCGF